MCRGAGNPQAFNRYSYAGGNPLRFSDPSGHCRYDSSGNFAYAEDCTDKEFAILTWDDRIRWITEFTTKNNLPAFDNIVGIIQLFRDNANFNNLTGWASHADSHVLRVIQDGFRASIGTALADTSTSAVGMWKDYFDQVGTKGPSALDNPEVWQAWGRAEQQGVNEGVSYANSVKLRSSGDRSAQGAYINAFVTTSDAYRMMITGEGLGVVSQGINLAAGMHILGIGPKYAFGALDPRAAGTFVYYAGSALTTAMAEAATLQTTLTQSPASSGGGFQ